MARATYGNIITDLKGSIGGFTFQHNGVAKIVHLKQRPRPRFSTKISVSHNDFFLLSQSWKALSRSEQAQWAAFALSYPKYDQFNKEHNMTGYNWYLSINKNLKTVGSEILRVPPTYTSPTTLTNFRFVVNGNGIYIISSSSLDITGYNLLLFTTAPVNFSSYNIQGSYRLTKIISTNPISQVNITSDWNSVHGLTFKDLISNCNFKIFCYVFLVDTTTGLTSYSLFLNDDISSILL